MPFVLGKFSKTLDHQSTQALTYYYKDLSKDSRGVQAELIFPFGRIGSAMRKDGRLRVSDPTDVYMTAV